MNNTISPLQSISFRLNLPSTAVVGFILFYVRRIDDNIISLWSAFNFTLTNIGPDDMHA